MVAQRGVADARELVGQGAGGLVVVGAALHIQRPAADAADFLAGAFCHLGRSQHAPGAVRVPCALTQFLLPLRQNMCRKPNIATQLTP